MEGSQESSLGSFRIISRSWESEKPRFLNKLRIESGFWAVLKLRRKVEVSLEADCGEKPKLWMRYETGNGVESSEVLVQK
jgi:hypothetical protein